LEKTEKEGYVILPYAIKLMENEEGKVEVDELDLGFCLIHVLYVILPFAFTKLLGVYRVDKEENRANKMIFMGVEHVIAFPNLFTQLYHARRVMCVHEVGYIQTRHSPTITHLMQEAYLGGPSSQYHSTFSGLALRCRIFILFLKIHFGSLKNKIKKMMEIQQ
jgi:hypothetical protein